MSSHNHNLPINPCIAGDIIYEYIPFTTGSENLETQSQSSHVEFRPTNFPDTEHSAELERVSKVVDMKSSAVPVTTSTSTGLSQKHSFHLADGEKAESDRSTPSPPPISNLDIDEHHIETIKTYTHPHQHPKAESVATEQPFREMISRPIPLRTFKRTSISVPRRSKSTFSKSRDRVFAHPNYYYPPTVVLPHSSPYSHQSIESRLHQATSDLLCPPPSMYNPEDCTYTLDLDHAIGILGLGEFEDKAFATDMRSVMRPDSVFWERDVVEKRLPAEILEWLGGTPSSTVARFSEDLFRVGRKPSAFLTSL